MHRIKGLCRYPFTCMAVMLTLFSLLLGVSAMSTSHIAYASDNGCHLNSAGDNIHHVIYLQFDNVHFTRDNPNVPSDLEQMPNLLNFIESNGVLLSNHHTPLIAHTATDILTSLTGVYGDRHGVPVSNSFRYFNPDGTSNLGVSFAYWTDPIFDPTTSSPTDTKFNMLSTSGKNAPAPWVPYTRAGCNFGAAGTANIELENTSVDIPVVFGANSPQAQEVKNNPNQASADFIGVAVHCAKGNGLCSSANTGKPDVLPNEPGGYNGYMGLFGHKYVAPQISPSGPLTDLNGNVIKDPSSGDIGFPGFDGMSAAVSLSYVASMQEHGIPVTYAYISDAHDNHVTGNAFGPGEAGYVAQLKSYDDAFGKFFERLEKDGINNSNTLFVVTADENDHFVGGAPSPAGCDGVNVPCTYSQIGEVSGNLTGLLATQQGNTTPFKVHADSAPVFYITGNPARDAAITRDLERAVNKLTAVNSYTGKTDTLTKFLADPVEMKLLHMITADPARTPSFTMFADPNYFLSTGAPSCSPPCVSIGVGFAWNHGDVAPDVNTTWLGLVGPGVRHQGVEGDIWSDHTDIRPTILALLGLKDDYQHEGRVLVEALDNSALPESLRDSRGIFVQLAQVFKQINAPVGELGLESLRISTKALASNSSGDSTYVQLENKLSHITDQRNDIGGNMLKLLEGAAFHNQPINPGQANRLIEQGQELLEQVENLN
ncbi:MAG: hypothetical protein E6I32_12760 [Chloroflexi bacterium]|nr:MAG: hypothetical protein E6I32_12760 [Chloroflexota bacterium]